MSTLPISDATRQPRPLSTARSNPARSAPRPRRRFDPSSAAAVATGLLDYLARQWQTGPLTFEMKPTRIPHGWETYAYRFHLRAAPGLPPEFAVPLVFRAYSSPEGLPRAEHEVAVQRRLGELDYPVAQTVVLERASDVCGGPFLILQEVPGATLLHALLARPWLIFVVPMRMAAAQVQLHTLPTDGFPAPAGPFLDRQLAFLRSHMDRYGLAGLLPGLDWLSVRRPPAPAIPRILHLDFHPINILCPPHRKPVVLDWTEADVGDHHADVAMTSLLLEYPPCGPVPAWVRPLVPMSRILLRRWYLRAYRWRSGLDGAKLAYYRAWAVLQRLCRYGRWLAAGPSCTGSKPSLLERLSDEHVTALEQDFGRRTGVAVHLDTGPRNRTLGVG